MSHVQRVLGLRVPEDRDPYEVLGVDKKASQQDIEAAYRRLVRLTHPDSGGTSLLFRQVKDAYDLLSDPIRRAKHDRGDRPPTEPAGASQSQPGWTRVDGPHVSYSPPPGGGFPPPRPGPTSPPPPPGGANPGQPFSDWGPTRWPGGHNRGGPAAGGAHTGSWNTQPPGTYSSPESAARPRGRFWVSHPWLIPILVGFAFLLIGTVDAGLDALGFALLVVGFVAAVGSRRVRERLALRHAQVGHADNMDGTTFEHFVAEVLRVNGYEVQHVGGVGDFGADLVITGPAGRSVVQVKRYSGNVGVDAVQQAAAARAHYGTAGAIVATNSYFTSQAVMLARSNGVELWDRKALVRLASKNNALAPEPALKVLGLQIAAGTAVVGSFLLAFLLAASASSRKRRRPARRRRRW